MRTNEIETYSPVAAVVSVYEQRNQVQKHWIQLFESWRMPVYSHIEWIVIFCS